MTVYIPENSANSTYISTQDFDEMYKNLYPHYDTDYSADNLIDNESRYYPYGYSYKNEESKIYLDIGHTGFFLYEKGVESGYSVSLESTLVKTYTPNEASESDESYTLSLTGKEVKASDALQAFQNFADDFVKTASYPNTLQVSTLYLYKSDDGYYYNVRYSVGIDGVYALKYYKQVNASDDDNQNYGYTAEASMYGSEVNYFCVQASYEIYGESEEQEQVPELSCTAKHLSVEYVDNRSA